MKRPFDTPRVARALEGAGLKPDEARAAALRLRAGALAGPPETAFEIPSRALRNELIEAIAGTARQVEDTEENILERVQAADRRHVDAIRRHLDAVEYRISQHLKNHERRIARLAWKLLAALVAILAIAAAALGHLT